MHKINVCKIIRIIDMLVCTEIVSLKINWYLYEIFCFRLFLKNPKCPKNSQLKKLKPLKKQSTSRTKKILL